jgi:4,5-DOPA dioxygenase extradiol
MKKIMPALFVGHGSPMNAIENNVYSREWEDICKNWQKPKAILSISAHWVTDGTRINNDKKPKTVYDMYGFPKELYKIVYNSPGAPELAEFTKELISKEVIIDNRWGIDHGTWSVLHRMYPLADIPVYQMSIDISAPAEVHYKIGQEIRALRENGVMILGSGNVVHNLSKINWEFEGGYPWAVEFDNYIKNKIIDGQHEEVINYKQAGESSKLAFVTPEHFYPLLYVIGASKKEDKLRIFNNSCTVGGISMTSYLFE